MREERRSAAVRTRREEPEVGFDELVEEPQAEEDPGIDPDRKDEHKRKDPGVRIQHEVLTEHGGDRAACAKHRHGGVRRGAPISVISVWVIAATNPPAMYIAR